MNKFEHGELRGYCRPRSLRTRRHVRAKPRRSSMRPRKATARSQEASAAGLGVPTSSTGQWGHHWTRAAVRPRTRPLHQDTGHHWARAAAKRQRTCPVHHDSQMYGVEALRAPIVICQKSCIAPRERTVAALNDRRMSALGMEARLWPTPIIRIGR